MRSTDNGASWKLIDQGVDLSHRFPQAIAVTARGTVLAAVDSSMVRLEENVRWVEGWHTSSSAYDATNDIVISPSNVIYASTLGGSIHTSTDDGATWTESDLLAPYTDALSFGFGHDGTIYAGGTGTLLFRSTDNGASWQSQDIGINTSCTMITAIAVTRNGSIFVSTSQNEVHRSTDNGVTWSLVKSFGSTGTSINLQILVPDARGNIYAALWEGGVYRSSDNGDTWEQIAPTWPDAPVKSLAVARDGSLLCGTAKGIYRSSKVAATSGVAVEPTGSNSIGITTSIAPNPLRDAATISYHLDSPQLVRLAVYDRLGREVAKLVDGHQSAGTQSVRFDGVGLPSGLYLCRLQVGDRTAEQSMMLAR
jgi:ligand-binding sensor domain-containing protein